MTRLDAAAFKDFIVELATAARAETLPRVDAGLVPENKAAGAFDPVTEADRASERVMRALIEARFPDHAIKGEEFPDRVGDGRYCWSLDPIDGTRSFICGLPSWVTLIALLEDGAPVAGAIDAPRLDELYLACDGAALLLSAAGEQPLRVSGVVTLAEARLSTTDPHLFSGAEAEAFERLRKASRTQRYGLDGYAYAKLAAGDLDLVVESGLKRFDLDALVPVVRAAGGVIGDWRGGDDFDTGQVVAAASRSLFDEALTILHDAAR